MKSGKHAKNGMKFFAAAARAEKLGKMKNAVSFGKAGVRAIAKADKVQKLVRNTAKGVKALFRQAGDNSKDSKGD